MRRASVALVLLAFLAVLVVAQRHRILVYALASQGVPELAAPQDEGPGVRWADDYFTVQALDSRTYALGEPRYYQQNFSYLIVGDERAVLFDAGPGHQDIRPIVRDLTDRPVTFVPSHFHYDHVGNRVSFDHVAVVDLPYLRARAQAGRLELGFAEHLGAAEGIAAPTLEVDEWLAPGATLDLGGRGLRVLYTPGHTEDSISLLDEAAGYLFAGDFIYPGPLFAFLPNSGMGDYLQGADAVLSAAPDGTRVFGAHRVAGPGAPELGVGDVSDLHATLGAIRDGAEEGRGFYPRTYRVNDRLELLAEPAWLQDWTPRRPGAGP
jgi:glyoxylase-like metal-dependent hydrolase (beta-lactamase superfamily II)